MYPKTYETLLKEMKGDIIKQQKQNPTCLSAERLTIAKIAILPKMIKILNIVSVTSPTPHLCFSFFPFFPEILKPILKSIQNYKGVPDSKNNIEKEDQIGILIFLNFRTYCKTMVVNQYVLY